MNEILTVKLINSMEYILGNDMDITIELANQGNEEKYT